MEAKDFQTLGFILLLIGFVPIAIKDIIIPEPFRLIPVLICAIGGLSLLIGLYLNGWALYDPKKGEVD